MKLLLQLCNALTSNARVNHIKCNDYYYVVPCFLLDPLRNFTFTVGYNSISSSLIRQSHQWQTKQIKIDPKDSKSLKIIIF